MMNPRKFYPLLLAHANDCTPIKGRTRFQKIIFLFEQSMLGKKGAEQTYSFTPYNFGPYSVMLQYDVNELVEDGYLKLDMVTLDSDKYIYNYNLTENGRFYIENVLNTHEEKLQDAYESLKIIKAEANETDLDALLRKMYSEYPEYARNSIYDL